MRGSKNLSPEKQQISQNKNRKNQIKAQIQRLADKVQTLSREYLHLHDLGHENRGMSAIRAEAKMKKRSIMATRKKIYKLEAELKGL